MARKGWLLKFVNRKFGGKWWVAADEMVADFCIKHGMPGSAYGYDFYTGVKKVWEQELKDEAERVKAEEKYNREWLKRERENQDT